MNFNELGMSPAWVEALAAENIADPTQVQRHAIPVVTEGRDAYISSETGTGKTLAYLLPLLERLDTAAKTLQFMVLVPTHELALQVQQQVRTLVQAAGSDIRSQVLVGGVSLRRQQERLKKDKPHLIAGTPERILELTKMRKLKVHAVNCVVIDEADRMLTLFWAPSRPSCTPPPGAASWSLPPPHSSFKAVNTPTRWRRTSPWWTPAGTG